LPTTSTPLTRTRTPSQSALPQGLTLPGGWRPVRLVSAGTLTDLYQARHADSPADSAPTYAIKLLRPEWAANPAAVTLLRREVEVTGRVTHPHLIPSLAEHLDTMPRFVVFPWLMGQDLADYLARRGAPATALAIWFARQVATALEALPQAGWTHGDVKPANILITAGGHATLLDLGFARRIGDAGSGLDRAVMGTPNYLPPEALHARARADQRGDLYALGVTLFELLTGKLPHAQPDVDGSTPQLSTIRRLRALNTEVPREGAELVDQLLAADPIRRPQSAREVIDRLVPLEIATLANR